MSKKFITEGDDSISKYFKEVRKIDLLTHADEIELAKRIEKGDKLALEKLVSSNLKFVISVAKEYQGQGLPLSDLIADGNEGLMKAALKYDHTKGFRFISYGVWWIKQSIMQGLCDNGRTVRLPSNIITKLAQIKKEIERFESENGRTPLNGEMDDFDENYENYIYNQTISLNQEINEDGDEYINILEDESPNLTEENINFTKELREKIRKIMGVLDEREKTIIESYFGLNPDFEGMTLEEIGDVFSISKERTRQIKERCLRKLRSELSILSLEEVNNLNPKHW
jgi:RNA polymerase primary sigma factor